MVIKYIFSLVMNQNILLQERYKFQKVSSKKVFKEYPDIKKDLLGGEL